MALNSKDQFLNLARSHSLSFAITSYTGLVCRAQIDLWALAFSYSC